MKNNLLTAAFALIATAGALLSTGIGTASAEARSTGAEYVSIGDSFIGNGSIARQFTSTGFSTCTAEDNVGHLTAALLPGVTFADWSCGGSDTDDITEATDKGPQIRGLSAKTKFVSVSIGGNDEDFFLDIVTHCLVQVGCTKSFQDNTFAKLERLPARLDKAYSSIREHAPNAHVVVLGTLRVLPDKADGCFVQTTAGQSSVDFANRAQRQLNETMARVAERHGFTAVNVWSDGSRSMCAADGQRYLSLTGVGPGDYGIPVHPTLAGRRYTASLIADSFKASA